MAVIQMCLVVTYTLLIFANNESPNFRPNNKTPTLLYNLKVINLP
jgi:hypothetical protein